MIQFYFAWFKMFLKWHLRMSRSKPGKWRHGVVWQASTSYHKDRWIWRYEEKLQYYERRVTPLEVSTKYRSEGNAGDSNYEFVIPKGYEIDKEKLK